MASYCPRQVPGEITLGENIADTGGLSIAIDAYKRWLKRKIAKDGQMEAQLPGIPLTPEQAMFVAYGQVSFVKSLCKIDTMSLYWDSLLIILS